MAVHPFEQEGQEKFRQKGAGGRSGIRPRRSDKPTAEGAGNARKKPCRQTLVVLQHDDFLLVTSEFGFHKSGYNNFLKVRQLA
jgi:hypothetical protein